MAALRAKFIDRARSDAETVTGLCEQLLGAEPGARPPLLEAISSVMHRLAGTAGTFGLDALGSRARHLDHQVAALLSNPQLQSAALRSLSEEVQEISRALHDAPVADLIEEKSAPAIAHSLEQSPLVCIIAGDRPFGLRLKHVLLGFGYRVELFATVVHLEQAVADLRPAAIVARLDEREGPLACLRRVSARQVEPAPTIVIAEQAEFTDYLAAVRAGADGYFVEPMEFPQLESRLHFLIERRRRDGLRVMLVDDDVDLLSACSNILEASNLVVTQVSDPSTALATLSKFRPEVIVMDIRMPECTGPELAQIIRLNEEWMHVPIVYMSTQSDGEEQLLATRKAGEAFIAKPIDANELIATVCANGRHARQMLETASRDTLTGLLKHSFIIEHLSAELERAHRHPTPTCAVMIDIDNFKEVNDLHGHQMGDLVIRTLATVLRQRLRVIDGIGRLGGEEFMAVLSNCAIAEAVSIMDGVRQRFEQIEFAGKEEGFHVTFSAGIAELGSSSTAAAELAAQADKAMYLAKALGRNRVVSACDLAPPSGQD